MAAGTGIYLPRTMLADGTPSATTYLTGTALWVDPLSGVAGGRTITGGTASGENLTLSSTSDGTKGAILIGTHWKVDEATGKTGINPSGMPQTYEALTILNGNVYLQSASEQSYAMKTVTTGMSGGRLGDAVLGPRNPVWTFGRVIASPPLYKAEWRWLYSDDDTTEAAVCSVESTGTWAGIRTTDGSFFEGFISSESVPMYRMNSSPTMGVELGIGGSTETDVSLRKVSGSSGNSEAWIDNGSASNACGTLKRYMKVAAKASTPYVVLETDGDTIFTNEGASAKINFTLPTAAVNKVYHFLVQDADGIRVNANTGDTILLAGSAVSASAGYAESTTIGSTLTLVAINATEWVALNFEGTWTVV